MDDPVAAQGPVDVTVRDRVAGHKTYRDGLGFRHEPLYEDEAAALMAQVEASDARRKELMPDEDAAIRMFFDAYIRLKDFGWRDAVYCPKDGTTFKVIEAGSTGKHDCIYQGDWPNGTWWIVGDGDMSPSRPVLFKAPNAELRGRPLADGPA